MASPRLKPTRAAAKPGPLTGRVEYQDLTREELEERCRSLEEARRAAEAANQAKSLFLANLSHEIRTPMNAILGYGQILQRAPDLAPKHRLAVCTIERSGGAPALPDQRGIGPFKDRGGMHGAQFVHLRPQRSRL